VQRHVEASLWGGFVHIERMTRGSHGAARKKLKIVADLGRRREPTGIKMLLCEKIRLPCTRTDRNISLWLKGKEHLIVYVRAPSAQE